MIMDDNIFAVDTSPSVTYDAEAPQYGVSRKSMELIKLEEKTAQRIKPQQINFNPCWNCGKTLHSIRECNIDTNLIAVEWNKELQMLLKERQGFKKSSGRYHDNENTSRHAQLPGTISPQLRKVMGLSENDLPPFIYSLRKHGYPKAWLRHASIKPSGLNLYDAHGNEVADPEAEDGEILEEDDKIRYDLDKLITFPGFNGPLPDNAVDNYGTMCAPAYNSSQNLEFMIEDLQGKAVTEYRLKKGGSSKESDLSLNNTDSSNKIETYMNEGTRSLPSLSELDLQNAQSKTPACNQLTSDTTHMIQEVQQSRSRDVSTNAGFAHVSEDTLGRILTVSEGTPVLKSRSGHARLPPPENFSKDICDVINFENLPESTGKFEKMRNLLKKVKRMLRLQREH